MALRTRGLPCIRQAINVVTGQAYSAGNDVVLNLGQLLKGYEQKGGLQTYLMGIRLHATLVFAGGGAANIGANGDFARWLRGFRIANMPHDIYLTGEYIRAWSWLRYQRWLHDDPSQLASGASGTKHVYLDIPFFDDKSADPFMHVDPIQLFIDNNAQLILTCAGTSYWDASNLLTNASCNIDVTLDVLRTPKKFAASPYIWKFEDRSGTPQILTVDGAIEYLDVSKAPVSQTAGLTELGAVFSKFKIDPLELVPDTTVADFARQWEGVVRQDAQNAETSAPSNLIDPVTPVYYFLPLINRSRNSELNINEQPYIQGDLSIVPTLASGSDYSARYFYRCARKAEAAHVQTAAAALGVNPRSLVRHNPGGNNQPDRAKAVSRMTFASQGADARSTSIARAGVK